MGWVIEWKPWPSAYWMPVQEVREWKYLNEDICPVAHTTRNGALADLAILRARSYDGPRGKWRIRRSR